MLNRAAMKMEAKEINRSAVVSAWGVSLLYLALSMILEGLDTYTSGSVVRYMQRYLPELPVPAFLRVSYPPMMVIFISVMVLLLGTVLGAGYALYVLGVRRGEEMPYTTLFDGFGFVGKVVVLELVMRALVTLGFMVFVVPGFILSYRYRFALYNLCENPEMSALEAMRMSAAQTTGHKGELFVMDLSFLGWYLVAGLTAGLLMIWVLPYHEQTSVGYFQEIKRAKGIGFFPPESGSGDNVPPSDPFGPVF
jgi:uncharacterized membrane protein